MRGGLQSPELVASLANSALQPTYSAPDEFARLVKQDYERWAPIVKSLGFTATD